MLVKLMTKVITKIKKRPYQIDENIADGIMLSIVFEKGIMLLKGLWHKIFIKESKGLLFVGKKVKLKCRRKMIFKGTSIIDDEIGENFSLGRNSIIECTGVINELGEKLVIGNNVGIAANAFIAVRGLVEIGDDTIIGPNVKIHAENHIFSNIEKPIRLQGATRKGIKIGKDCWIGSGVTILDGVTIGDGCVIAAGAVVTKSFENCSVIGGVPAKLIKNRKSDK